MGRETRARNTDSLSKPCHRCVSRRSKHRAYEADTSVSKHKRRHKHRKERKESSRIFPSNYGYSANELKGRKQTADVQHHSSREQYRVCTSNSYLSGRDHEPMDIGQDAVGIDDNIGSSFTEIFGYQCRLVGDQRVVITKLKSKDTDTKAKSESTILLPTPSPPRLSHHQHHSSTNARVGHQYSSPPPTVTMDTYYPSVEHYDISSHVEDFPCLGLDDFHQSTPMRGRRGKRSRETAFSSSSGYVSGSLNSSNQMDVIIGGLPSPPPPHQQDVGSLPETPGKHLRVPTDDEYSICSGFKDSHIDGINGITNYSVYHDANHFSPADDVGAFGLGDCGTLDGVPMIEPIETGIVPYTPSVGEDYYEDATDNIYRPTAISQDYHKDEHAAPYMNSQDDNVYSYQNTGSSGAEIFSPSSQMVQIPAVTKSKWDDDSTPQSDVDTSVTHQGAFSGSSQNNNTTMDSNNTTTTTESAYDNSSLLDFRPLSSIRHTDIHDYQDMGLLGQGAFGAVFRAANVHTAAVVAIKKISFRHRSGEDRSTMPLTVFREISILWGCQHPNIVGMESLSTSDDHPDRVYLIMEYVDYDLGKILRELRQPFTAVEQKSLMHDLLQGVAYLHNHQIMHRDLKPSNLLLSRNGVLKIADLGLARYELIQSDNSVSTNNDDLVYCDTIPGLCSKSPKSTTHTNVEPAAHPEQGPTPLTPVVQTLWYRAPEVLLGARHYNHTADLWSVGCIMAQFITRKPLLPGRSDIDQVRHIFSLKGSPSEREWPELGDLPGMRVCSFPHVPKRAIKNLFQTSGEGAFVSDLTCDLIDKFLMHNPQCRLAAHEALEHDWFREYPALETSLLDSSSDSCVLSTGDVWAGNFKVLMEKEVVKF